MEVLQILLVTIVLCTVGILIFFWCFHKRSPRVIKHALSRTDSKSTAELEVRVFKEHYGLLQVGFQSPDVLAGNLYAKGIIDEEVRDGAQSPFITPVKKSQILLNAVEKAIKMEPQHFYVFLSVLAMEQTTEPLYKRLLDTYVSLGGGTCVNGSPTRQDSKETQTIMPLPQRLQVHVPVHCATIKATNGEKKPKSADEKLTLAVSILDVSSGAPLKCSVALSGDELIPSEGQIVCFLSVSVSCVGENNSKMFTSKQKESLYNIWRSKKSDYSPNGRATFYMCFYEADMNYIITLNIAKVHDEEGIECMGYTVEHYTGFISTVKTVERNAFKAPPLLKYKGAIASAKFNKLMSIYNQMFYQGKKEESNMIMSRITSSDSTAELDVKLYMSVTKATEKSFDPQTIVQLEELFQRSQSLDSNNGFLLQALIMMSLSQTHSFQGRKEKALECIHHSRSICLEAAPSHLTSCVFFNDARNMMSVNKGTITPKIKRRILELFDRAIADSYYGTGWERLMIFNGHVYKALFCLNGMIDLHFPSTPNYAPTEEDISIAEQHLNAAPLDVVCEVHMHIVIYYIACSDLHRWKGNVEKAREFAEKAKRLCTEKGYFPTTIRAINDRLKLLEPDTVDEVLEMFKEHDV